MQRVPCGLGAGREAGVCSCMREGLGPAPESLAVLRVVQPSQWPLARACAVEVPPFLEPQGLSWLRACLLPCTHSSSGFHKRWLWGSCHLVIKMANFVVLCTCLATRVVSLGPTVPSKGGIPVILIVWRWERRF